MNKSIIFGAIIGSLALTGCDSEPQLPAAGDETYGDARIEICGGVPALGASSRADEPSLLGYCNADRLRIFWYEGSTAEAKVTAAHAKFKETLDVDILHYTNSYNRDRWTQTTHDYDGKALIQYVFALPSLAFTKADEALFVASPAANSDQTALDLKLTGTQTPELFFGRLGFEKVSRKGLTSASSRTESYTTNADGTFYHYNGATTYSYHCPVAGKLYRMVSQLNIKIEGVNPDIIEKMELYVSNVPTEVKLYGSHGAFYPVATTDSVTKGGYVLVDTATDFSKGIARLSTYLLPSNVGRSLRIRLYATDDVFRIDDNTFESVRDFDIEPSRSAYLTGADAEVYGAKSGESLYVYDLLQNLFYSYANVRVNLGGNFFNFFADKQKVALNLEVCPGFEKVHEFIID